MHICLGGFGYYLYFYFLIQDIRYDKEIERAVKENDMRKKALSKLTDEEKKLLGIYK